jgi:hypothetical protein
VDRPARRRRAVARATVTGTEPEVTGSGVSPAIFKLRVRSPPEHGVAVSGIRSQRHPPPTAPPSRALACQPPARRIPPPRHPSSGNPRKFIMMVYIPGIYPTYDDIQYIPGCHIMITMYIRSHMTGIYQVYTICHIPVIYLVYTCRMKCHSIPGVYLVYTFPMKLCAPPGCRIAIEMQQHTGIGLQGCLMFCRT